MKDCCNKWWERLTEYQKEWIHYVFYDIESQDYLNKIGLRDVHEMHESRFELEGYPR